LVELLVVIGIIAVLISLLLPALSKARQQASLVACSAQLRQLGIAARAYAVENRDALPPWNEDIGQPDYNSTGSLAARTVNFPWWGNRNPPAALLANPKTSHEGANVGRLVVRGFLKGPWYKVQQCPAAYDGESRDPAGESANYNFNVHMAFRTNPLTGTLVQQPWWKKISQYGRVKATGYTAYNALGGGPFNNYVYKQRVWALATDPIMANTGSSDFSKQSHLAKNGYAVNLMTADGSVQTVIIPKFNRAASMWGAFLDLLGYIELAAAGNGTGSSWSPGNKTVNGYAIFPENP
jgi:type II secretory pathway pseudopilin PulG